ncbi:MAG: hypothetical protein ABSA07_06695 [Acidimicrobiales bacterium]|jgi:hypothetical protein
MAACGHCGGCCAHCGATCGTIGGFGGGFGGGGFGGMGMGMGGYGSYGGFGFHPWFGSHRKKDEDDGTQQVDAQALADPEHPGHRDAVKAISHIDPAEHSKMIDWLKKELAQVEKK